MVFSGSGQRNCPEPLLSDLPNPFPNTFPVKLCHHQNGLKEEGDPISHLKVMSSSKMEVQIFSDRLLIIKKQIELSASGYLL